jgi:hypothetical protein
MLNPEVQPPELARGALKFGWLQGGLPLTKGGEAWRAAVRGFDD